MSPAGRLEALDPVDAEHVVAAAGGAGRGVVARSRDRERLPRLEDRALYVDVDRSDRLGELAKEA